MVALVLNFVVPALCASLIQLALRALVTISSSEIIPNIPPHQARFLHITFRQAARSQFVRIIENHLFAGRYCRTRDGDDECNIGRTRSRERTEPSALAESPHSDVLRIDVPA